MSEKEETVGDRVREIREDQWQEKQGQFAARLNATAKRLKVDARYDNTIVSKMETGARDVGLDDVIVIAAVDKKKRGREWLAWGSAPALLLDPSLDRGLTAEEEERAVRAAAKSKATRRPRSGDASA